MPRFLASGYGLSQSLSFLDKRIAGSGNEIVLSPQNSAQSPDFKPWSDSSKHKDYKRIETASGDEPQNKLNKSNGGQI